MKIAFYFIAFIFVSFFMDISSFLLGSVIGGGNSEIGYAVMAISLLAGVIVCCTIYIGNCISKNN